MADVDARLNSPAPAPVPAPARAPMAVPTRTPAADPYSMLVNRLDQLERSFEERVQQVKQHSEVLIVEQGQWIEARVQEPL
jgi:hypothetical protein